MNEFLYSLFLAAVVSTSGVAQNPCGSTTERDYAAERYSRTLKAADWADFREEAPRLEAVADSVIPLVVTETRECARLQRPIREAIRAIYPSEKTGLDDFTYTIFRVGPYYLVYLGVHEDVIAQYGLVDSLQPLLFIRAADLQYIRYTMIK